MGSAVNGSAANAIALYLQTGQVAQRLADVDVDRAEVGAAPAADALRDAEALGKIDVLVGIELAQTRLLRGPRVVAAGQACEQRRLAAVPGAHPLRAALY